MLTRRLTESGPGVVMFDWDGDGADELFFGTGAGGKTAAYKTGADGRLAKLNEPAFAQPLLVIRLASPAGWMPPVNARCSPPSPHTISRNRWFRRCRFFGRAKPSWR